MNGASAGSTVCLAAGTYTQQVTLGNSVSLQGAGGGHQGHGQGHHDDAQHQTVLQAPSPLVKDALGYADIIDVSGGTSTIQDLTVTGPGPGSCGSISYGIFVFGGASATIHRVTVADIADQPLSGCQNGVAIEVGDSVTGQVGHAWIQNDVLTGYQKNGITVDGASSTAAIQNNIVEGIGPTAIIAQNGIQVSDGASATVTNNRVSGNAYCDQDGGPALCGYVATGILTYAAQSVLISNNRIAGSDVGVYDVLDSGAVTVTNNLAQGGAYDGFDVFTETGPIVVSNNRAIGNGVNGFEVDYETSTTPLVHDQASGNAGDGFLLYDTSGTVLAHDQARGNGMNGFELDGSASNTLSHDAARNNGANGFFLDSASTGNTLTHDQAAGNGGYGFLDDASPPSSYSHNSCSANEAGGSDPTGLCHATHQHHH